MRTSGGKVCGLLWLVKQRLLANRGHLRSMRLLPRYHPPPPIHVWGGEVASLSDRVRCTAVGAEAVRAWTEVRLGDWLQNQLQDACTTGSVEIMPGRPLRSRVRVSPGRRGRPR